MNVTSHRRSTAGKPVTAPVRLLSGFSAQQRKLVLQAAELRSFPANSVIVTGGDPATHLFLLRRGRIKYYHVMKNGDEVLLAWLLPGDAFGIGTLLKDPQRHVGTAVAVDHCELLVWSRENLRSLGEVSKILAENVIRILLYYLEEVSDRLVGITAEPAKQRLARTLIRLCRRSGQLRSKGMELEITNEYLAALANVSPFTASRHLKKWERQGVIQKRRGQIVFLLPDRLLPD